MKRNVFDKTDDTQDTVLSHSIQEAILADAKKKQYGTFQTALKSYVEQNSETLKHGIDDIESLFPSIRTCVRALRSWSLATRAGSPRS